MAQKRGNSDPIQCEKKRSFDGSNRNHYDIGLAVEETMFHVIRMHVSAHSTVLNNLLYNVNPNKLIIRVRDVDVEHFRVFLEAINGEICLTDENVAGVLKVARTLDSRTATRRCEHYLMKESELSTNIKFELAAEYNFEALKTKAVNSITTVREFLSIVSGGFDRFDEPTKDVLLAKSIELHSHNTPPVGPVQRGAELQREVDRQARRYNRLAAVNAGQEGG